MRFLRSYPNGTLRAAEAKARQQKADAQTAVKRHAKTLGYNSKQIDQALMPAMHRSTYSLAETFDVGRDTGTQVDPAYAGDPFPFTGALDRVVVTPWPISAR